MSSEVPWDVLATAGAAVLALALVLLLRLWRRRVRRARTYSAAAPGADLAQSDPRWAPGDLESDEDLRTARRSVRVEPRVVGEPPPLPEVVTAAPMPEGPPASSPSVEPAPVASEPGTTNLDPLVEAVRSNPQDALVFQDLAIGLAAGGLYRTAAVALRQALRIDKDVLSYFYLAVCLQLIGRRSWARQALKLSVRTDKGFAPARAFLGYLALEEGDTSGAAVYLAHSMALDPERPEPHLGLAWLHMQRGEQEEAEWEFEEALRSAPNFAPAVEAVRGGTNPIEVVRWDGVFVLAEDVDEPQLGPPEATDH